MLRVLAYYHNAALALDDFALFANLFYGWLNLHFVTIPFLFSAPGDSTLGKVVNGNLNGYLISRQYPYIIHSEFARNVGIYDVSVGKLYLEVCIRQCLKYNALELYYIILRQKNPSSSIYDTFFYRSIRQILFVFHSVSSTLVR